MISRSCITVLVVFASFLACGTVSEVVKDLPVVEVELNGHKARIPYYEDREPISDFQHDLDNKLMREIGSVVKDMSRDALESQEGRFSIGKRIIKFIGHGKNIIDACKKNKAMLDEMRKEDARLSAPAEKGYMVAMAGLVQDTLNYDVCSNEVLPEAKQPDWCKAKKLSNEVREEHINNIALYMDLMSEITEKSPIGIYLNYRELTIDDRPVAKAFGEEASFFRKSGYSAIVKILSLLAYTLKKM